MTAPKEREDAWAESTYPYQGFDDDLLHDLPPSAFGSYSSLHAPNGLQDQAPQDLSLYDHTQWGHIPDLQLNQLWYQHLCFTSTPIPEELTFPSLQSHDASMQDGYTDLSHPFPSPTNPFQTLINETQPRSATCHPTDVERNNHNLEALLHNAQASTSDIVFKVKEPTARRPYALDKVVGKSRCNNETGELQGFQYRFGHLVRMRKLNPVGRLRAATMRQFGACALCRESKKQCNLAFVDFTYQVCKSCANSPLFKKNGLFRMPCFKSSISAAEFFRLKPSDESPHRSTKRDEVYHNQELNGLIGPVRIIQLTQGDKIAYEWEEANKRYAVSMPPFCIMNVQSAKESIETYVRDSRLDYISNKLKTAPPITQTAFDMAFRFSIQNKNSLVQPALEIWSASRIIEDSWYICGSDTLGVKPVQDPANPCWHEKVPVTPIMDTQLDQFVIQQILMPRKDALLPRLQLAMENFKRESWFELFLTIFVLLSSIEVAGAHQSRFARRYGYTTRFANHKEMLRGALPIHSLNWKDRKSVSFAQLNEEQMHFMEKLQGLVAQEGERLRNLRSKHKYDHFLYWCHQLLLGGWEPGEKEIEDEIL